MDNNTKMSNIEIVYDMSENISERYIYTNEKRGRKYKLKAHKHILRLKEKIIVNICLVVSCIFGFLTVGSFFLIPACALYWPVWSIFVVIAAMSIDFIIFVVLFCYAYHLGDFSFTIDFDI